MTSKKRPSEYICWMLCALLLLFNFYYFVLVRNGSFFRYIENQWNGPRDNVQELAIYQGLVEDYFHLNVQLRGKSVIVFLGDSITKGFNLNEYFPDLPVLNRGVFYDTTEGLIKRLDKNISNLNVKKLFLMIGHNDLEYRSNQEIVRNIVDILSLSKAETIYLQSILPVTASKRDLNKRIVEINELLKAACAEKKDPFIDLHSRFLDSGGGLSSEYTRDGVHLNAAGYRLWRDTIKAVVN